MKTFIVETIGTFRQVHVVAAESEEDAYSIASEADCNWQEYLGELRVDCQEYTEEHIKRFQEKDFFWSGTAFRDPENDGIISYKDVKIQF